MEKGEPSRSGPGPQYPVTTIIGVDQSAVLDGCIDNSKWCQVEVGGVAGWAYSEYLVADYSGERTVVYQNQATIGVPVITYDNPDGVVAAGPVAGTISAGTVVGDVIEPAPTTRTYIEANPVDQVYLDGEVVVGGTLPPDVDLYEVPEGQYRYVYINGQEVLVTPDTRQIVYVYR